MLNSREFTKKMLEECKKSGIICEDMYPNQIQLNKNLEVVNEYILRDSKDPNIDIKVSISWISTEAGSIPNISIDQNIHGPELELSREVLEVFKKVMFQSLD